MSAATNGSVPGAEAPHKSPWLDAHADVVAGIKSHTSCMQMVDLAGDGDYRLLIADFERKLKVYRGTKMIVEHALLDQPVALCAFYTDDVAPRTPAIGVASGPFVFIYRNLRPYFKFTVPAVEIDANELEIWRGLKAESSVEAVTSACEMLTSARDNGTPLSSRSLDLLAIEDPDGRFAYVESVKEQPPRQDTVITCMSTMGKSSDEPDAVSSLVIGTESKLVIILDPAATTKQCQVELASVPIFMAVTGTFDVEWRIVVACRDGRVYQITIGDHRGVAVIRRPHIELETQPCGLARLDKGDIYVATMDSQLHCYSIKGKKKFSIHLGETVTNLETFRIRKQKTMSGLLVALANGEVRMYRDKQLITVIKVEEPVAALRFGQYGREESSLVIITKSGALFVKMLQRTANLESLNLASGPPPEQDVPLQIPKKTRVYVDQTQREKEMAIDMHRVFQRDLCKLRLETARSYVKLITDGQLGVTPAGGSTVMIMCQVQGLGPFFKLKIELRNSGQRVITNVPIVVVYDFELYRMRQPVVHMPVLLPNVNMKLTLDIDCLDENAPPKPIRILALNATPNACVPLVSSLVTMPQSELLDDQA